MISLRVSKTLKMAEDALREAGAVSDSDNDDDDDEDNDDDNFT